MVMREQKNTAIGRVESNCNELINSVINTDLSKFE